MRSANPVLAALLAGFVSTGVFAQTESKPASPSEPAPQAPSEKPKDAPAPAEDTDPSVKRDVAQYNLEKDKAKPAVQGYDLVAYFPEGGGEPKKGDAKHAFVYRGVTYWFANEKNLEAFKKNPRKYEPAYGGWCAYAMGATGEKVEIDPKSFKITDGRLYLFYKDFFNDTRSKWSKDETSLKPKADTSWKKTSGEAPPAAKSPK